MKLTDYRAEVLTRIRDHGPLTVDEARQGHPNIMRWLLGFGLVKLVDGAEIRFGITEAGRAVLAAREAGQ